jgi:hypothetical protein
MIWLALMLSVVWLREDASSEHNGLRRTRPRMAAARDDVVVDASVIPAAGPHDQRHVGRYDRPTRASRAAVVRSR